MADDFEDALEEMDPCEMEGNDGPFYIKLYPFIVRKSDGSEGTSVASVIEVIEEMKAEFAPYNIFFHTACIQTFDDTDTYLFPELGLSAFDEPEDGLSLLLYDIILTGDRGMSAGIPSKKIYALVEDGSAKTKLLSHEVGHALALYHTHNSTTCSNHPALNEYVDGTDCCLLGDYVCDTDASPNLIAAGGFNTSLCTYSNSNCVDPDNAPYVNADPLNIMSYGGECRRYFTEGQGERMRNYLANAETEFPGMELIQRNEAYVAENTTWEDPFEFDVDVIVKEGADLIVESTASFVPEKRIILEKGSTLTLDGATLTVAADDVECPTPEEPFWGGILLENGDAQTAPAHAFVWNGSIVEHAKTAFTWTDMTASGYRGRVRASNSQFLNNYHTFHFAQLAWGKQFILPSIIGNSVIKITDDYKGEIFESHAYLVNYQPGLMLIDCEVSNEWSETTGKNRAVFAYQSRFWSVDNNSQAYPGEFDGFSNSVVARRGVTPLHYLLLRDVVFGNNDVGLLNNGFNFSDIEECTFNLRSGGGDIGIKMENSTGYSLTGNDFTSTSAHNSNTGLWIFAGGSESTMVSDNHFTRMGRGILVGGSNTADLSGLQFRCNQNSQNAQFDFEIGPTADIAQTQGTEEDPAGNTFTHLHPTFPQGSDLNNHNSSNNIDYWYDDDETDEEPINVRNVTKRSTFSDAVCDGNLIIPGLQESEMEDIVDSLWQLHDYLYGELQDNPTPSEEMALRSELHYTSMLIHGYTSQFIRGMLSDTVSEEINYEKMRTWLALTNSFESDLAIADTYLAEEDFSEFEEFVDDIPVNRDLTGDQEEDLDLYERMTAVIIAAVADDRSEAFLNQEEVDSLEVIAEANDRRVARVAKNILETFYGYDFDDTYDNRGWKIYYAGDEQERSAVNVIFAYPNPSSGSVMFTSNKPVAILEIYTLLGLPIDRLHGNGEKIISWDSMNTWEGVYVYRVVSSDGTITSDKLRLTR